MNNLGEFDIANNGGDTKAFEHGEGHEFETLDARTFGISSMWVASCFATCGATQVPH